MRTFNPLLLLVLAAVYSAPVDAQTTSLEAAAAPEAYVYVSEETDLRVRLPIGWKGVQAINETELPGRATYRWEATDAPLTGAVVLVERVVGLNPLMEERWRRGQVASGYNGLRPTGSVPQEQLAFGPSIGLEIASGETVGRVYFVQRGQVFWSVHVSAPASVLLNVPPLLDGLSRGVLLSSKTVGPAQASR